MKENPSESWFDKCSSLGGKENLPKFFERSRSRAHSKEMKKPINETKNEQKTQEDYFPDYLRNLRNSELKNSREENNYNLKKSHISDICGQTQKFEEYFPCEDVSINEDIEESQKGIRKKSSEILKNSDENLDQKSKSLKNSLSSETLSMHMDYLKI